MLIYLINIKDNGILQVLYISIKILIRRAFMSMRSMFKNGVVVLLAFAFVFVGTTMVMAEGDRLVIG